MNRFSLRKDSNCRWFVYENHPSMKRFVCMGTWDYCVWSLGKMKVW